MRIARLDLDTDSRQVLEFDAVLAMVAGHASTPLGAAKVKALEPLADALAIEAEQAKVEEAARHLSENGRLVHGGLPDPGPVLEILPVEGARIPPAAVRDLAIVLLAAADLRSQLSGLPASDYPLLRDLGRGVPDLRSEASPAARHVLPDGRIADDASQTLARIRASLARVGERLNRMLGTFLREPGAESVIQDDFITQRNGRFVIPVRSDAPRPVRGIVHASSSSGATLFVEPLESVELNNDRVRLAEEEIEEEHRIVAGWVGRLRERREDVVRAVGGVAVADSLQALAAFAASSGATRPVVQPAGPLQLREVRHPLLDRRLREREQRAVPSSVELQPQDHVLVLSGPNAGGKTVALKTLGLAVLMAQAGVPVCATEARLPLFVQVRADIGDHQSIEADLSTFSAHVQAVARFLRETRSPVLFLFDEIGTGTDPAEGAALARAILQGLLRPGFTTVATTHQGAVKAWAFTTPGAVSAALEFDTERLRPTYRIVMGAAGVSAGLDVAARLGLGEEIVSLARDHLGGGSGQAEAYVKRLRDLTAELEKQRQEMEDQVADLSIERERQKNQAAAEAERVRRETHLAFEAALREFREESRRELASIRDKRERARLEREQMRAERRLELQAQQKEAEAAPSREEPASASMEETVPGMKVRVQSLGKEGEVVSVRGDRVEVQLGRAIFTVGRSDLRAVPPGSRASAPSRPSRPTRPAPASREQDLGASPREIVLIGKTVDEGLDELDKFLDDAALEGHPEIRVVHGHGTGRLRAAVRRFLSGHPHVESHRPGSEREGGDGATVARLKGG